jgi:hypothetical protein
MKPDLRLILLHGTVQGNMGNNILPAFVCDTLFCAVRST